jgi:hypothetical protein
VKVLFLDDAGEEVVIPNFELSFEPQGILAGCPSDQIMVDALDIGEVANLYKKRASLTLWRGCWFRISLDFDKCRYTACHTRSRGNVETEE